MKRYILGRILLMAPTLLGAGILIFFLMRVIPGDICLARWVDYGSDLDPTLLELCRSDLGLNAPLYIQFARFFEGIMTLDFGVSLWTGQPIIDELNQRFGNVLESFRRERWRLVGDVGHENGHRSLPTEGSAPPEQLVENAAQTVEVATSVDLTPPALLGAHILQCADKLTNISLQRCHRKVTVR